MKIARFSGKKIFDNVISFYLQIYQWIEVILLSLYLEMLKYIYMYAILLGTSALLVLCRTRRVK